jgi:glycosyltransferase involved in cell wall biosynthesis
LISLRVLQIVQKPERRGAEVFAYQLNQWLRKRGHQAKTVYLYSYPASESVLSDQADLTLTGVERHGFERLPGLQPRLLRKLRRFVREFSPDIVQLNGDRTVKYGAAVKLLERNGGWKLVYRNIDSPVFWVRGLLKKLTYRHGIMPRVDGVIGVSRQTLAEVRDFYRLSVPHVFIPNGVDFELLANTRDPVSIRAQLCTPPGAVVALFIGNLSRQKRADRFLRTMLKATAEVPDLYGWLLGDGPERPELETQVAHLGLTERIRFLGYRERVGDFINAAEFLVLTSDTEGIPAVVLEAGYLGRPTVGPRVGGMQECVLHEETGLLVTPGDEEQLVSRVIDLARDHERRKALGAKAHSWSRDHFSIERIGAQYETFFLSLLADHEVRD